MKKLLMVAVLAIAGAITGCEDAKFAYLVTIQVSPGAPTIVAGHTQQFTAQGTFSNGMTRDLTSLVTWTSSSTSVASIAAGGLATANTQGSSTISASLNQPSGMVTGSTTLTVTAPTVTSIQVSPGTSSVAAGLTQQFTAQATLSNGTKSDVTSQVTWSSSAVNVASITAAGLATTHSQGSATITATYTGPNGVLTSSATLTVTEPALVSILVADSPVFAPPTVSVTSTAIAVGTTHQYVAYGLYSDSRKQNITTSVNWAAASANPAVASIKSAGRVLGLIPGTTTITATDPVSGLSQTVTVVVTNATVTSIVVSPSNQTAYVPLQLAFSARGKFSDGTSQDVTADASWSSTNTPVATITGSGVATAVSAGSTTVQAALGGVTGSTTLNVSSASLVSISFLNVPQPATSIAIGSTIFLQILGTYSDGTKHVMNSVVAMSVTPSDGSIAAFRSSGLLTGVAAGTATVKAQVGGVSQTETVHVEPVSSLAVTPAAVTIAEGTTTRFSLVATLQDGTIQDLSSSAAWTSSNAAAATIDVAHGGWVQGIAAGNSTIVAVFGGQSGVASLTVTNATLSSLAITPTAPQSISLGTTKQYKATATFSDSTTQDVTSEVDWTSLDPAVAVVSIGGLATSTGVGSTMVKATATINGISASDDKALTVF